MSAFTHDLAPDRALVLLTHGWGGSPQEWAAIAADLRALDVRVHAIDHQGWRPTPRQAGWNLLGACTQFARPGLPLLLIGHSLGAAVSVLAAGYCSPDAVLALAPTTVVPGSRAAAARLGDRLTVAVGSADMLTGPTRAAEKMAQAAGTDLQVIPGVTHAGFLIPSGDRLGRRLRAVEARAAQRRGRPVDDAQQQRHTVTAFCRQWIEDVLAGGSTGAGRTRAMANGVPA